jgi:hypothetical protein
MAPTRAVGAIPPRWLVIIGGTGARHLAMRFANVLSRQALRLGRVQSCDRFEPQSIYLTF